MIISWAGIQHCRGGFSQCMRDSHAWGRCASSCKSCWRKGRLFIYLFIKFLHSCNTWIYFHESKGCFLFQKASVEKKTKTTELSTAKIALLWQNPLTISHQLSVAKQSLPHGEDVQSMIAWCLRFLYTVTKGITSVMVNETTLPITELIRECILPHRTTCSLYILE